MRDAASGCCTCWGRASRVAFLLFLCALTLALFQLCPPATRPKQRSPDTEDLANEVTHGATQQAAVEVQKPNERPRRPAKTKVKAATSNLAPGRFFGVRWNSSEQLRQWLVAKEELYGGHVFGVPCGVEDADAEESPKTQQTPIDKPEKEACVGGDRMLRHSYGQCYARVIDAFAETWERAFHKANSPLEAAEVGVLVGSGVAIWSDLFLGAKIHALDRVKANILNNTPFLESRGAFRNGMYELHGFDQSLRNHPEADAMLKSLTQKFFWIVDDASHIQRFTIHTFNYFRPYLDTSSVYIIEDVHYKHKAWYRQQIHADFGMYMCRHAKPFYALIHRKAPSAAVTKLLADGNSWEVEWKGRMPNSPR